jgi:hypothetical protein
MISGMRLLRNSWVSRSLWAAPARGFYWAFRYPVCGLCGKPATRTDAWRTDVLARLICGKFWRNGWASI